ncbi:MAG: hypothetical protein ACI8TL_000109 [Natronomonas sp.]|jgi:hypothetical protein
MRIEPLVTPAPRTFPFDCETVCMGTDEPEIAPEQGS